MLYCTIKIKVFLFLISSNTTPSEYLRNFLRRKSLNTNLCRTLCIPIWYKPKYLPTRTSCHENALPRGFFRARLFSLAALVHHRLGKNSLAIAKRLSDNNALEPFRRRMEPPHHKWSQMRFSKRPPYTWPGLSYSTVSFNFTILWLQYSELLQTSPKTIDLQHKSAGGK